jgi:hypothetical protein
MVYKSSNPMLCSLFIISIYCSISLSCSFINFIWLLISSIKLSCIRSRFLFSSKFSSASLSWSISAGLCFPLMFFL